MKIIAASILGVFLLAPGQQFPQDPFQELQRRAARAATDKNYKELQQAAAELADVSKDLSAEIDQSGKDVISAQVFEKLDKIEKLAKRIRDKAKGGAAPLLQVD